MIRAALGAALLTGAWAMFCAQFPLLGVGILLAVAGLMCLVSE